MKKTLIILQNLKKFKEIKEKNNSRKFKETFWSFKEIKEFKEEWDPCEYKVIYCFKKQE